MQCPGALLEISSGAFEQCASLETVELNEGLRVLGPNCFSCTGLLAVAIPRSVVRIEGGAFAHCSGLEVVEFAPGSALQVLRATAFAGTPAVRGKIDIPAGARE